MVMYHGAEAEKPTRKAWALGSWENLQKGRAQELKWWTCRRLGVPRQPKGPSNIYRKQQPSALLKANMR